MPTRCRGSPNHPGGFSHKKTLPVGDTEGRAAWASLGLAHMLEFYSRQGIVDVEIQSKPPSKARRKRSLATSGSTSSFATEIFAACAGTWCGSRPMLARRGTHIQA